MKTQLLTRRLLAVVTASALALPLAACGSSDKSGGGGGTIASGFILGGPPEFKTRADGVPGLKKNYGVQFGKYKVTDTGGPVTVKALKQGQIDAADLFTTDPAIKANGFVVLEDPKSNFAAQNIVPLINKAKATPGVRSVLNAIQAKLTDENLGAMIGQVANDKKDPADVAATFLADNGVGSTGDSAKGVTLSIGSANFPESVILAEIYAGALQAQGAKVTKKLNIGSREKYFPALEAGSLDLFPEYSGTVLQYKDKNATATSSDDVYAALGKVLPPNLVALDKAAAQDSDAIVVTKQTAAKYKLKTIADLAKKG